jgi:hypothetical protein
MSPVRYELGPYIPEDDILHSRRRGNLRSGMDVSSSCCHEQGSGLKEKMPLWVEARTGTDLQRSEVVCGAWVPSAGRPANSKLCALVWMVL